MITQTLQPKYSFLEKVETWGDSFAHVNYARSTFQISRALLAFASLCTILFSPSNALFTVKFFNLLAAKSSFLSHINLFVLLGLSHIWIAKLICIAVFLAVISGYRPMLTGILHWYVAFSYFSALTIIDGGDQITAIVTLFMIPISLCDKRVNAWRNEPGSQNRYPVFLSNAFLFLIQVQVSVIYLNSGIAKITVPDWNNGSAYYYWFMHNAFGAPGYLRSLMGNIFSNSYVVTLISWGTMIFEISLFGCLFSSNRTFKKTMFKIGIVFHLLIFLVHGLFSFFVVMSACLTVYLLSNDQKPLNPFRR